MIEEAREVAELIRDNMIGVARELSDRRCGASQSEMREAQIEYLASVLGKEGNKAGGLWYRRWFALQSSIAASEKNNG